MINYLFQISHRKLVKKANKKVNLGALFPVGPEAPSVLDVPAKRGLPRYDSKTYLNH